MFTAPLGSGNDGVLDVTSDAQCGDSLCVLAAGTRDDPSTWTGGFDVTLENSGDASIVISRLAFDGSAESVDDFALLDGETPVDLAAPALMLEPNGSKTLHVAYANTDSSAQDIVSLVATHDGLGCTTVVPLLVVAPRAP